MVRVSDVAWAALKDRSIDAGFSKPGQMFAHGIAKYLSHLFTPLQDWTDTRPEYLKALSARLLDSSQDRERIAGLGGGANVFPPADAIELGELRRSPTTGAKFPLWWDPDITPTSSRRPRGLSRKAIPWLVIRALAIEFGIVPPTISTLTTPSLAGAVLEAVGQKTLTPKFEPMNSRGFTRRTIRKAITYKEIDW